MERSSLSLTDTETAVKCSAAFPTFRGYQRQELTTQQWLYAHDREEDKPDPFRGQAGIRCNQAVDAVDEELRGHAYKNCVENHNALHFGHLRSFELSAILTIVVTIFICGCCSSSSLP